VVAQAARAVKLKYSSELWCMLIIHDTSCRVPTHPGKSWIFSWIIQTLESPGRSVWSWKVLEMKAEGPGKYWKMKILDS